MVLIERRFRVLGDDVVGVVTWQDVVKPRGRSASLAGGKLMDMLEREEGN